MANTSAKQGTRQTGKEPTRRGQPSLAQPSALAAFFTGWLHRVSTGSRADIKFYERRVAGFRGPCSATVDPHAGQGPRKHGSRWARSFSLPREKSKILKRVCQDLTERCPRPKFFSAHGEAMHAT